MRSPARPATALGRSFDVYYRDRARTARMDRLNADFIKTGQLAFDIGAHIGDRTASFLRLGASVVALEPQPRVFRALRLLHGRNPGAVLRREAVGARSGTLALHLNTRNPTVATLSPALVAAASGALGWEDQTWDETISVPVTTLDALIAEYGAPDFIKIDVEGHEADALSGLNTAVPALSFEFTTIQRDVGLACIDEVLRLGAYEFNLSLGEDHALQHRQWLCPEAIRTRIAELPQEANSGDVYARRL
ncbi:FkbM family methyltransferase [Tropicimonas sp. S265A]|uniref:FkbM family methyltransferase n=1 Tax=Tropicimonas sp. S265A TaxID=3415134 RepID=UPI003C79E78A